MRRPVSGDSGFTLVETLVSLVVLGFIVAGLAQGLHFGMSAWDRQVMTVDRDSALDSTDRTLRTLLARMAPGDDPHQPTILGESGQLTFIAELPENAPAAPTRLADIQLGLDAGHRLVLRWTPHLHARLLLPEAPQDEILLTNIRDIRFAFYRDGSGQQAAGWVAHWRSIVPPALIRMHIDFAGPRRWPDVIVAPMREPVED